MPTRVLLATDFSDVSEEAARKALEIAARDQAILGVCHVSSEPASSAEPILDWLLRSRTDAAETGRPTRAIGERRVGAPLGGGVRVETFVDEGPAHAGIVKRAQAFGADLIVVGSHGRTGLARVLLGSVAERVVRLASCPVLVARPGPSAGPVVTATDLSEASKPGLRAAALEAARGGGALHAIYVFDLVGPGVTYAVDTSGRSASLSDTEALHKANEELRATVDEATRGLPVEGICEVLTGEPAAAIVRRAEELSSRLVVVATRGRTGIARMLLGSVAERIVRLSHASVLAVHGASAEPPVSP